MKVPDLLKIEEPDFLAKIWTWEPIFVCLNAGSQILKICSSQIWLIIISLARTRSSPVGWSFCFVSPLPFPFSYSLDCRPPLLNFTRAVTLSGTPGRPFCFPSTLFFRCKEYEKGKGRRKKRRSKTVSNFNMKIGLLDFF